MKNKSEYLDQLQFLRFLGFFLIFIHHLEFNVLSLGLFSNCAINAVSFFIILSGYLYGYTSYKKDIKFSFNNMKKMMWSKIKKIYPLYFVTYLFPVLYSIIPFLIVNHYYTYLKFMVFQLIKCLLLVQSWFPSNYFLYNSVGWFISTILFLYLITNPLLSLLGKIKKYKHSNMIYILISIMSIILSVLYCYLTRNTSTEFTQYVFPVSRVGEYLCGMSLGYFMYDICSSISINNKKDNKIYLFTILEIIALFIWITNMFFSVDLWKLRIVHWIIPNLILISIFTVGRGYVSKFFKLPYLKYLGDISFECYLTHFVIICIYKLLFGLESVSSWILCFLIVVVISTLIHLSNDEMTSKKKN